MVKKIVGISALIGCSLFVQNAIAQINLSADQINFRSSVAVDGGKLTTHFGKMDLQANSGYQGGAFKATENSSYATAIKGYGIDVNSTGGYFSGGSTGLSAVATFTSASTGSRIGGNFQSSGGVINFGVRSYALGTNATN